MSSEPLACLVKGCGKTWAREPALEVACPVCSAPVGVECTHLSPSGHRKSKGFQGLPPWGHNEREALAGRSGAFGACPFGKCSEAYPTRDATTTTHTPEPELSQLGFLQETP